MFGMNRLFRKQAPRYEKIRLSRARSGNRYYRLLNVFLFTVVGFFSYYFILFSTEWWQLFESEHTMFLFGLGVVVSFDVLCGLILWLNSVINTHYPFAYQGVGRMFVFFILVAGFLVLYNYSIYDLLLRLFHDTPDLNMGRENWMRLALISLIDLLMLCLILLNQSARYTLRIYREAEQLRQNRSQTELRALQAQLNPHFLFNSLNTLLSEIEYDPDNAKVFTTRLADVYRYILQVQDKETVPLVDEMEFMRAYLYLHQVRIGHGLKFETRILPEGTPMYGLRDKRILPLALQLLVENILKHNTVSARRPLSAVLTVDAAANTVTVENEIRLKKNVKSSGYGLKNLAERYRLSGGYEMVVERSVNRFKVRLPLFED